MAALVIVINGYLLVDFFSSEISGVVLTSTISVFTAGYVGFIVYLIARCITFSITGLYKSGE